MEVYHRVTVTIDSERRQQLLDIGIEFKSLMSHLAIFEINDTDDRWPLVDRLIDQWGAGDIVSTKFMAQELTQAQYLEMTPGWHSGFPEPQDDYLSTTYKLDDYCRVCGIGKVQAGPFRIKGEPRWGAKQILQLNWIFDEFFVKPDTWLAIFEPLGIESRPVINDRTGKELITVVQLVVPSSSVGVRDPDALVRECCNKCGRTKFVPVTRGMFPALDSDLSGNIAKTTTYFGSGHSAWQAVLISAKLFLAIRSAGVKGASFVPVTDCARLAGS